jgi:iron complex outermembrane receptor protein
MGSNRPLNLAAGGFQLFLFLLCAGLVAAQESPATAEQGQQQAGQPSEEKVPEVHEVMVVTASRTEQMLSEAPAAVTVITSEEIENAPADDYGDLLRNVPGLNVSQISARDIQVTGRGATNSLATSELVLVDGRTLYLDFFGFVMWDFLPVNTREIKQIEVVRGPGSAVWGANALTGVINLITKSPKEMVGTDLLLGGGELSTGYGSISHAGVNDKLSYKLSAAYYTQDPYERPTGLIPGTMTTYPPFQNQGTSQPKFDVRVDYDQDEETTWSFSGGYAGTDGIIHSGIGPFDINTGSNLSYFQTSWSRRAMRLNFFGNFLDGDAANLLTVGPDGRPLLLGFQSQTYNIDFTNTTVAGEHNVFTYGANTRHNSYDLTIAPLGDNRDEFGAFIQDEILLGDKVRWVVGGRVDNIDPIGTVFSPRTSLLFSPNRNNTFRFSFNRAFRAPSLINNYIDVIIINQVVLPVPPSGLVFNFPSAARGNPDLTEERQTAYEVGYVGTIDRATISLAVYRNELKDATDFFTLVYYSAANPPPGWPLPPQFVPPNTFPAVFSYRNIGKIIDKGFEASLDYSVSNEWSFYANYSYQANPDVTGIPEGEINQSPHNRFNLGLAYNGPVFYANGNLNYQAEAFWTDVLDSRFWGPTDSFTQVNAAAGVKLAGDHAVVSVIASNLFDERVQQHVFGDIISRKVVAELRFHF